MSLLEGKYAKTTMPLIPEDNLYPAILKTGMVILVTVSAATLLLSARFSLGVAAGGAVAILNFIWIRSNLAGILTTLPGRPAARAAFSYIARLSVSAFLLYGIIVSGLVSIAGLLTGLSVIVASIMVFTLFFSVRRGG